MLRVNLDVADGLVNGSIGWVAQVDVDPADGARLRGIWVDFDRGGDRWKEVHNAASVMIQPRQAHYMGAVDGERVRR
eukprot:9775107-Alexandrium_andersonii.AAC.1